MYVHRAFVTPNIEPPCKDCPDRVVGCHSKCEKYKSYKRNNTEAKKDIVDRYKGARAAENYTQAKYHKLKMQRKVRW
jgi:hypothetical protein